MPRAELMWCLGHVQAIGNQQQKVYMYAFPALALTPEATASADDCMVYAVSANPDELAAYVERFGNVCNADIAHFHSSQGAQHAVHVSLCMLVCM